MVAKQPPAETIGAARGRCLITGVTLKDVAPLLERVGLTRIPPGIDGAQLWEGQQGYLVAAREDAGAVFVAGELAATGDAPPGSGRDERARRLLEAAAPAPQTPGLRALALPGSLGGVLLRTDPMMRFGDWVGLRQVIEALDEVPEAVKPQLVAIGVAIATAVDSVVPGARPDAEDVALVISGDAGQLVVTITQSLTAQGAAVVGAALGGDAPTLTLTQATPGVELFTRFGGAAAKRVAAETAGGEAPHASMHTLTQVGIWGYPILSAHVWSLWAAAGDAPPTLLTAASGAPPMDADVVARWGIDAAKARGFLSGVVPGLGAIGAKRYDGVLRRTGRAMVARWVVSAKDGPAPSVSTPDWTGVDWEAPDRTPEDGCLGRAGDAFVDLLTAAAAEGADAALLSQHVAKLGDAGDCLGASVPGRARFAKMLWASRMLLADQTRPRDDKATVTAMLAGACDQDALPAACTLLREITAAPDPLPDAKADTAAAPDTAPEGADGLSDTETAPAPEGADAAHAPDAPASPPAGAHPTVKVTLGNVTSKGYCAQNEVELVLKRRLGALRYCLEQSDAGPGELVARFAISLDGNVAAVSLEKNTTGKSEVGACVASKIRRMSFARPEGGICVVNATLDVAR